MLRLSDLLESLPPIIPAVFRFRAIRDISTTRFFTGPQWGAYFCDVLDLRKPATFSQSGLLASPLDSVACVYMRNEVAAVSVTQCAAHVGRDVRGPIAAPDFEAALRRFEAVRRDKGQLTDAFVFEGSHRALPAGMASVDVELLDKEALALSALSHFTLRFDAPLRLKQPGISGERSNAEKLIGPDELSLEHIFHYALIRLIGLKSRQFAGPGDPPRDAILRIVRRDILWLEAPYKQGDEQQKNLGGIVGQVSVEGSIPHLWAGILLLASRLHIGARSHGLGRFSIPEIDEMFPYRARPGESAPKRIGRPERLEFARQVLQSKGGKRDPQDAGIEDLRRAGKDWLGLLSIDLCGGTYSGPDDLRAHWLPKDGQPGHFRLIVMASARDRLLQRSAVELLGPAVDAFLSCASFAYRRGLNREGAEQAIRRAINDGYTLAIKADIKAFFDSVRWDLLEARLKALFGDALSNLLMMWVRAPLCTRRGRRIERTQGLPQGLSISPMLSNLVLDSFDRELSGEDLRLIRFGDDFVVMCRSGADAAGVLSRIQGGLSKLGFELNEEKTAIFPPHANIRFLGFTISRAEDGRLAELAGEDEEPDDPDLDRLLLAPACHKRTVYAGDGVGVLRSEKTDLLLVDDRKTVLSRHSWSSVARIVVLGWTGVTGAATQAALLHRVPILYLDYFGQMRGETVPLRGVSLSLAEVQRKLVNDPHRRLSHARELVAARLNNMHVVLRRKGVPRVELLDVLEKRALAAESFNSLLGFEGAGSAAYWEHWRTLALPFDFPGRRRRPPPDAVNALLSLMYTLLYNRTASILRGRGFDVQIGFYHVSHGAHAALASDLMEELRHLVELTVLRMIKRKQVTPEMIPPTPRPQGGCHLPREVFKTAVLEFERSMQRQFSAPGLRTISYNEYLDEQASDLRAALLLPQMRRPLKID